MSRCGRYRGEWVLVLLMASVVAGCSSDSDSRDETASIEAIEAESARTDPAPILGVDLGMSDVQAENALSAVFGVPLDANPASNGYQELSVPMGSLEDSAQYLFGTRILRLGLVVRPDRTVVKVYAMLSGQSDDGPACDDDTVEAMHDWARAMTRDAEPDRMDGKFGSISETYRRFEAQDRYVDTLVSVAEGDCNHMGIEIGAATVPGSLDQHRAFAALLVNARRSSGFLDADHGTYVPVCNGSTLNDSDNRTNEFTVWSEADVAYLNLGRRAEPSAARLVERLGDQSFVVEEVTGTTSLVLPVYRMQDDQGNQFELAIGNGRLAFVQSESQISSPLTRCEPWAW